jgi:hypothetical protein
MRRLKRAIIKEGFIYQLTLYGALHDNANDKTTARRIDIYSRKHFAQRTFNFLVKLFIEFPPKQEFSIWTYDSEKNDLQLKGKY